MILKLVFRSRTGDCKNYGVEQIILKMNKIVESGLFQK
jgi:hypothetical protein